MIVWLVLFIPFPDKGIFKVIIRIKTQEKGKRGETPKLTSHGRQTKGLTDEDNRHIIEVL